MKKLLIIALVSCFAATSFGQMLAAGTSELKVGGLVDFETADDTLAILEVFYGVFWWDYVEIGAAFRIEESDNVSIWSVGLETEYNFDLGNELVPYVGIGLAVARYDIELDQIATEVFDATAETAAAAEESDTDDTALVLKLTGGAKYFVTENVAVSGALALRWATEDIYWEEESLEDSDATLEVAMRFFF